MLVPSGTSPIQIALDHFPIDRHAWRTSQSNRRHRRTMRFTSANNAVMGTAKNFRHQASNEEVDDGFNAAEPRRLHFR